VEPRLQERLRLHALDLQLHLAEADVSADAQLDDVADLG
jgi:hypothetical protein